MIRRLLCLLLALACILASACAEGGFPAGVVTEDGESPEYPPAEYEFSKSRVARYKSDTLIYTIESFTLDSVHCYLTKIWVKDPEKQIRKANAPWKEKLSKPLSLAGGVKEAMLASNASGYITKRYPDIPENYPGVSEDYYYTTLGSLVITDGEELRNLEGVPFWGLALNVDGITLYRGADNSAVLALKPRQTWAFFEPCAMQVNGESVLPEEGTWELADFRFRRTILARVNRNNYLMLHVRENKTSPGLSLHRLNRFFSRHFSTEWVYNLDGGPSSCLMCRKNKNARMVMPAQNGQQIADIIFFTE